MSTITQLLCNNFGGIRQKNAVFSADLVTAQDIQNVELYYTEINSGIGIRTMKGNIAINSTLKDSEKIINIFESTQGGVKHCYIHTEGTEANTGKLYKYDFSEDTLTAVRAGMANTTQSVGFDVAQGWDDLFFFTNGVEMFTVQAANKTLYAFVYSDKVIYADDAYNPTTLYSVSGNMYAYYGGTEWTVSGGAVKYNGNAATYTAGSNVTLTNPVFYMSPKDRDGRTVLGVGATLFAGKLWIFKENILWYSVTSNIYDFATNDPDWDTSAGYVEFEKNITAIHEYLNSLAVFHADSSELLSIDSNNNLSRGEESPAGCASLSSLVFHDTNLYFYDDTKKSVFSFKQVVTGEKTLGENIAVEVQEELQKIDPRYVDKIKTLSVFIEGRNEIWWLIPTSEDNRSIVLIFDYLKGEWVKRKCQKINCIAIYNNTLYSGSDNGVLLEEYQTDTFDGEYIQHYYKCTPMNLGAMNTLKVFLFPPRVSLDLPYQNDFYVKYEKNYDLLKKAKLKHIKAKNKGLFYYGDPKSIYNAAYYAPKRTGEVVKFPNATFKILEITIYTEEKEGSNFSIKNIEFSKIKVKQV